LLAPNDHMVWFHPLISKFKFLFITYRSFSFEGRTGSEDNFVTVTENLDKAYFILYSVPRQRRADPKNPLM
jgi:hypothetical protein